MSFLIRSLIFYLYISEWWKILFFSFSYLCSIAGYSYTSLTTEMDWCDTAESRSITGCRPAIGGEEQTRYTGKYYSPPLCFA